MLAYKNSLAYKNADRLVSQGFWVLLVADHSDLKA